MFIGEYSYSLDEKGRIAIPVKFRGALAEGLVVTRGLDGCLFVYPRRAWQALTEKFAAMPLSKQNARAFSRFMMSGAMELAPDRQGRVVLPAYLREYAGLKKEVVITGVLERFEIWNQKRWNEYQTKTSSDSVNIAEQLDL